MSHFLLTQYWYVILDLSSNIEKIEGNYKIKFIFKRLLYILPPKALQPYFYQSSAQLENMLLNVIGVICALPILEFPHAIDF